MPIVLENNENEPIVRVPPPPPPVVEPNCSWETLTTFTIMTGQNILPVKYCPVILLTINFYESSLVVFR